MLGASLPLAVTDYILGCSRTSALFMNPCCTCWEGMATLISPKMWQNWLFYEGLAGSYMLRLAVRPVPCARGRGWPTQHRRRRRRLRSAGSSDEVQLESTAGRAGCWGQEHCQHAALRLAYCWHGRRLALDQP